MQAALAWAERRGIERHPTTGAAQLVEFDPHQESEAIGEWIAQRIREGVEPHEIGVFVRSPREMRRARLAVKASGVPAVELSDKVEITPGGLSIGTMHLAKGLEFRASR